METKSEQLRHFNGPFIVLGMIPNWPAELERRKEVQGVPLTSLIPMTLPSASPEPVSAVESTIENWSGGKHAERVLSKRLSPWFLDRANVAINALTRKPCTAQQLARACGMSVPTAYAVLELFRRRGFPLKVGRKGKARTFQLLPMVTKEVHPSLQVLQNP